MTYNFDSMEINDKVPKTTTTTTTTLCISCTSYKMEINAYIDTWTKIINTVNLFKEAKNI